MNMRDCIFCKIVAGEIPAEKIYEDEHILAFMDIAPINHGHVLIIPRDHHGSSATIPEDVAGRMFRVAARIGVAQKRALDCDGFNLHLADGECAGQVVMHAHLHVIPRGVEDGFHWNWRHLEYATDAEKTDIAKKIILKFKIES
jgi:histidine triad (HIT) family protein